MAETKRGSADPTDDRMNKEYMEKREKIKAVSSLSRNQIKFLAIILMTINHIGWIFLQEGSTAAEFCKGLGYFTAPVMCYFLVEGFYGTRSVKRYAGRLLVFALIAQVPFDLAITKGSCWTFYRCNMLFTLLMCVLMLQARHTLPQGNGQILAILVCVAATFRADWGGVAPAMVLFFDLQRENRLTKRAVWAGILSMVAVNNVGVAIENGGSAAQIFRNGMLSMTGPVLACVVLLHGYHAIDGFAAANKKSQTSGFGKSICKWFFYVYYPAHLLVFALVRLHK